MKFPSFKKKPYERPPIVCYSCQQEITTSLYKNLNFLEKSSPVHTLNKKQQEIYFATLPHDDAFSLHTHFSESCFNPELIQSKFPEYVMMNISETMNVSGGDIKSDPNIRKKVIDFMNRKDVDDSTT